MDATISARFSARPYDLRMRVYTIESNVGGNYSRYRADRYAISISGYGSYTYNNYACESWVGGYYAGGSYSLPFGPGGNDHAGKQIGLGSYDTGGIAHAPDGSLNFTARIRMVNASVFGTADTGDVWLGADHLPRPPAAPSVVGVSSVTPTSMVYQFSGNWDGGSPITRWQVQYDDDPNFGSPITIDSSGTSTLTGLTPGTPITIRSRGSNAYWDGAWSANTTQTTLPATAPGISVVSSLSGQAATVTLTPPGAASGVSKYRVERRQSGTTIVRAVESPVPTVGITGLVPGTIYEWRASAFFGTYESPYSAWIPVIQRDPNTNPGDYYDGSSAPKDDVTYAWSGTAHASTSHAVGRAVDGWAVTTISGMAVLHQATGGQTGAFSARMLMIASANTPGVAVGMANAPGMRAVIEDGGTYYGSLAVKPSRIQRLGAYLTFHSATGAVLASFSGAQTVVGTSGWTTLYANGLAPQGAEFAVIVVRDQAGTGWSPWLGGETMQVDDAQVTLGSLFPAFNGSTPDAPGVQYDWLGPAHASVSTRTPVAQSIFDPLADPDCDPLPLPPLPPIVLSDCITEIGTWRRYTIQIPSSEVPRWSSTLPTLRLQTGTDPERQVRIRYYPNPEGVSPGLLDVDSWEAEQILTYIPPNSTIQIDGVARRVWAEVDGGPTRSADHLLFGTNGVPATWPELRCGVGYVATLDVPTEAPTGNLTTTVLLTQKV